MDYVHFISFSISYLQQLDNVQLDDLEKHWEEIRKRHEIDQKECSKLLLHAKLNVFVQSCFYTQS
ncbi:hypothetical protein Fmac_010525 [Flemingia macrophylla]|uniref:Uncharacterized protein n=1 Tax=Flemingia macrophylla TaxID=520843 RepID=A0ABD1MJZ0_9FABA